MARIEALIKVATPESRVESSANIAKESLVHEVNNEELVHLLESMKKRGTKNNDKKNDISRPKPSPIGFAE